MKLERAFDVIGRKHAIATAPVILQLEDTEYEDVNAILRFHPKDETKNGYPFTEARKGDRVLCFLDLMTDPPMSEENAAENVVVLAGVCRKEWAIRDGVESMCWAVFNSAERAGSTSTNEDGETVRRAPWHQLDVVISREEYEQLIHLAQMGAFFTISFFLVFPESESDSE